jgi:2-polyprenyl-3-methyl-5-hydroxy-6-metoxy-1,4-benzoquinol methylase
MIERLFRFQASGDYDSYTVHYTWHKKRRVIRELFKMALNRCAKNAPRVSDIGCGDGYDLFMLRELPESSKCAQFAGMDLNADNIAYCRARAEYEGDDRLQFTVRDIVKDPLELGELGEIVLCSEVVEHLAEPQTFLASLAKAMPEGGLLVLTTPNGASWSGRLKRALTKTAAQSEDHHEGVGHISIHGRKTWRSICSQVGLSLVRERRGSSIYGSLALDSNRWLSGMAIAVDSVCDFLGLNDLSWETLQLYVKSEK